MKKKQLISLFITSCTLLSSCSCFNIINDIVSNPSTTNNSCSNIISPEYDDEIVEGTTSYNKINRKYSLFGFQSQLIYNSYIPSTGNVNLLAIPVLFDDFSISNSEKKSMIDKINTTLFGESSQTSWESVSSFYKKSSFNILNINGKVSSECYDSNLTTKNFANKFNNSSYTTEDLIIDAIKWYKKNNPDEDMSIYDLNNDGYIDGVYLIYLTPYNGYVSSSNSSLTRLASSLDTTVFWAFTSWTTLNGNKNDPQPAAYFWCSYYFIEEGYGEKGIDAHTFIHETGHMLSLDDYYSYNYISVDTRKNLYTQYNPLGGADMMDFNVIDHNCYSKFALGWVEPYLIDKEGSITISESSKTGDCILIPTGSFNNSVFDEYLMLELFSPTNLNEHDLKDNVILNSQYWKYKSFYNVGIRMYHVDSRLFSFETIIQNKEIYATNGEFVKDPSNINKNKNVAIANTNTPSGYDINGNKADSYNISSILEGCDDYRLICAITPECINYSNSNTYISNSSLFYKNHTFDMSKKTYYTQFPNSSTKFANNSSSFLFNFSITSMTKEKCTIKFTLA